MNRTAVALSALALFLVLAGGAGTAGAATPGFAVYKITGSVMGISHSLTVNETVAATSSPANDQLILRLVSGNLTLSYSRSINSSDMVSPFIPSITNQSFSFSYGASTVSASIARSGTSQIAFQGSQRTLTDYSLSADSAVNGTANSVSGTISTFQSGLVYSVVLNTTMPAGAFENQAAGMSIPVGLAISTAAQAIPVSLSVTLLSTSLPLNASSASASSQIVSAGIGVGVAASAIGVGLGVRRHSKHNEAPQETKPEHWVD